MTGKSPRRVNKSFGDGSARHALHRKASTASDADSLTLYDCYHSTGGTVAPDVKHLERKLKASYSESRPKLGISSPSSRSMTPRSVTTTTPRSARSTPVASEDDVDSVMEHENANGNLPGYMQQTFASMTKRKSLAKHLPRNGKVGRERAAGTRRSKHSSPTPCILEHSPSDASRAASTTDSATFSDQNLSPKVQATQTDESLLMYDPMKQPLEAQYIESLSNPGVAKLPTLCLPPRPSLPLSESKTFPTSVKEASDSARDGIIPKGYANSMTQTGDLEEKPEKEDLKAGDEKGAFAVVGQKQAICSGYDNFDYLEKSGSPTPSPPRRKKNLKRQSSISKGVMKIIGCVTPGKKSVMYE